MTSYDPRHPFTPLDRRGIALPVALLALVAVTLMVTTVMLTSGSEGALARAHTDATQSLYDAESALQRYTIETATAGSAFTPGTFTVSVPGNSGRTAQISVVRLASRSNLSDGSTLRTWALTAEGLRASLGGVAAGRAVTAMVLQRTPSANLNLNIQSAITLGGDLDVNGNAFMVNGQAAACRNDGGVQAVQMSDSSQINVSGNSSNKWDNFIGWDDGSNTTGQSAIDQTALSRTALAWQVLGNKSLATIVSLIGSNKKWCMSASNCTYKYTVNGSLTNRPLWTGSMPSSDSVAVVDGNGGSVEVTSGRGVLIITNGSLLMKGTDKFDGIIIVDGNFTLEGTPTVTGALISLAMNGQNQITQDQSAIAQGHITVQFNQCTVNAAAQAFANQAAPSTVSSVTFAWSEIVR